VCGCHSPRTHHLTQGIPRLWAGLRRLRQPTSMCMWGVGFHPRRRTGNLGTQHCGTGKTLSGGPHRLETQPPQLYSPGPCSSNPTADPHRKPHPESRVRGLHRNRLIRWGPRKRNPRTPEGLRKRSPNHPYPTLPPPLSPNPPSHNRIPKHVFFACWHAQLVPTSLCNLQVYAGFLSRGRKVSRRRKGNPANP
jgi:hypothetical protein